jgi:hypothetical protein
MPLDVSMETTEKRNKPPTEVTPYRLVNLLPIMAKVSERLLLSRREEAVPLNRLIVRKIGEGDGRPLEAGARGMMKRYQTERTHCVL